MYARIYFIHFLSLQLPLKNTLQLLSSPSLFAIHLSLDAKVRNVQCLLRICSRLTLRSTIGHVDQKLKSSALSMTQTTRVIVTDRVNTSLEV